MFISKRINVGFQDKEVANYIRLAYEKKKKKIKKFCQEDKKN